jgi:hypothetical protein
MVPWDTGQKAVRKMPRYCGPDSDYDIFILVNRALTRKLEDEISFALYDLEYESDVVLSVHIYEKSFFQNPLGQVMPLFNNVRTEGVRI